MEKRTSSPKEVETKLGDAESGVNISAKKAAETASNAEELRDLEIEEGVPPGSLASTSTSGTSSGVRGQVRVLSAPKQTPITGRGRGRPRIIGSQTTSFYKKSSTQLRKNPEIPPNPPKPVINPTNRKPSARIAYQRAQELQNSPTINETESFVTRLKKLRAMQSPSTPAGGIPNHHHASSAPQPSSSTSKISTKNPVKIINVHLDSDLQQQDQQAKKNDELLKDKSDNVESIIQRSTQNASIPELPVPASNINLVIQPSPPTHPAYHAPTASQSTITTSSASPHSIHPLGVQDADQFQQSVIQAVLSAITKDKIPLQQVQEAPLTGSKTAPSMTSSNMVFTNEELLGDSGQSRAFKSKSSRGNTSNRTFKRLKECENAERQIKKTLEGLQTAVYGGSYPWSAPTPPPSPAPAPAPAPGSAPYLPHAGGYAHGPTGTMPWMSGNQSQNAYPHLQPYHLQDMGFSHQLFPSASPVTQALQYITAAVPSYGPQISSPYGVYPGAQTNMPQMQIPHQLQPQRSQQALYCSVPSQQMLYSGQVPQQGQAFQYPPPVPPGTSYMGPSHATYPQIPYQNAPQYFQPTPAPQQPFYPPSQH